VDGRILQIAVAKTAAAALLARHWPAEHAGRHDAFLALAGTLAHARWTLDQAKAFHRAMYRALWPANPDFAAAELEVETSYQDGRTITGLPTLADKIAAPKILAKVLGWLNLQTVGLRYPDSPYEGVHEREDDIAGRDLSHGLVERICGSVRVCLRGPKITGLLLTEGLFLVHPPVAHGRREILTWREGLGGAEGPPSSWIGEAERKRLRLGLPHGSSWARINTKMAEIQTRAREGIVLIDVVGSMSGSAAVLAHEVSESLASGSRGVILNLQEATYIDSTWLGAIVQTFAKLSQAGGRLKLLNVPPKLMDLFVTTKLSTIFDIFTSEDDAVNSFFPSRPLRYPRIMREDESPAALSKENQSRIVVFLCHSSSDKPVVRELHRRLISAGAKPWLDEVDLLPGQVWEREIPAAVKGSDAVLICLSSKSVGKTGYLQREIKFALDAAEEQSDDSIFLIPARLEQCDVPDRLRRWQWVDLFAADGYDRLVTALQARALALGRSPVKFQSDFADEGGEQKHAAP
jgi:anti-anti-sigma factor